MIIDDDDGILIGVRLCDLLISLDTPGSTG